MRIVFRVLAIIGLMVGSIDAESRLVIPGNRFVFGVAPQNSTIAQFFWFKSEGTDTVHIKQIKTGCDCTTIPLERNWIAPGDSLSVGVYWDTQRKVGSSGRYPYIYIEGQEEAERLYLLADVSLYPDSAMPISAKPFKAELSKMSGLAIDSVRITLSNRSDKDVAVKLVSIPGKEYQFSIPDGITANSTATATVLVAPEYKEKEFVGSVTLQFLGADGQALSRLTIPIRRKIIS